MYLLQEIPVALLKTFKENQQMKYMFGVMLFYLPLVVSSQSQEDVVQALSVSDDQRSLRLGEAPFLWIGGTVWGMTEWLSREEIDFYLDDRKSKGFNLVQVCLFWGKRHDDPVRFFGNPENKYGHRAFEHPVVYGKMQPAVTEGGSIHDPNDYWDHVDYLVDATRARGMVLGILPLWGRRYVNATHKGYSNQLFDLNGMYEYGAFLGERYLSSKHIIWVLGGDVKADAGGDFRGHYRAMAEGIIEGGSSHDVSWDEDSPGWDLAMMTYHPDGAPMVNSSTWFHRDAWLDFNMVETHKHKDDVYQAISQDYMLIDPIKPTVMGEPAYEGLQPPTIITDAKDMRQQAYHTLFAGGAGFTYGGFRDTSSRGPLFSPFGDWKPLLNMEGAESMLYLRRFCEKNDWPFWLPVDGFVAATDDIGVNRIVATRSTRSGDILIYFPSAVTTDIVLPEGISDVKYSWYDPRNGNYSSVEEKTLSSETLKVTVPFRTDALLILELGE